MSNARTNKQLATAQAAEWFFAGGDVKKNHGETRTSEELLREAKEQRWNFDFSDSYMAMVLDEILDGTSDIYSE